MWKYYQSIPEGRDATMIQIYNRMAEKKSMKVLQWPVSINLIDMLWQDFKRGVHKQKPSSFSDLKQDCWRVG